MKRTELYRLIWQEPAHRLAPQFGMSGRGLAKLCKRLDIPLPPRGYWAKLHVGKPVSQTPLQPQDRDVVIPRLAAFGHDALPLDPDQSQSWAIPGVLKAAHHARAGDGGEPGSGATPDGGLTGVQPGRLPPIRGGLTEDRVRELLSGSGPPRGPVAGRPDRGTERRSAQLPTAIDAAAVRLELERLRKAVAEERERRRMLQMVGAVVDIALDEAEQELARLLLAWANTVRGALECDTPAVRLVAELRRMLRAEAGPLSWLDP